MLRKRLSQTFRIWMALMLSVLSSGILQTMPVYAFDNAGVIKVVDELGGSENPNNEPMLTDCDLALELYNYGNTADQTATVSFTPQPPTSSNEGVSVTPSGNLSFTVPGDGNQSTPGSQGSNDPDGVEVYTLSFTGSPKTEGATTGYKVKVSVDVTNSTGSAKTKVFWMPSSCETVTEEEAGTLSVETECEEITLSSSGIDPEDGVVTYEINDVTAVEGSNVVAAGAYKVELLVNGTVVDTKNVVVEACEEGEPDTNQGLCHATGSGKYVLIDHISSEGIYNGHYGAGRDGHQDGNDVIPPFTYNGETYFQNWDSTGQALFRADCETPRVPTVCTLPTQTFVQPWTYDGATYPDNADYEGIVNNATYEFLTDGLHLSTPDTDSSVYGLMDAGNTPLADVDAMNYKSFRKAVSAGYAGTQPAYILVVDTNGTSVADGIKYFFYEPYYNTDAAQLEDIWQTWDAYSGGDAKWYMEGTGQTLHTWDYFVEEYPDAVVTSYGFNQGTYNSETHSIVQDITFDCGKTSFSKPGQGGGTVGGDAESTTVPAVAGVLLPAVIPATGDTTVPNPMLIILLALATYGAVYFAQGKRHISDIIR